MIVIEREVDFSLIHLPCTINIVLRLLEIFSDCIRKIRSTSILWLKRTPRLNPVLHLIPKLQHQHQVASLLGGKKAVKVYSAALAELAKRKKYMTGILFGAALEAAAPFVE